MSARGRILIAGAGIGGLATALAVRAQGFEAVVLEQAHELAEIGAAIGVQTNAVRALREIGVADGLVAVGVPIEHYQYVSWRGRRLASWPQGDIGRGIGEPTVVVHRGQLQRVLLGGLPDGVVRLDSACVGYIEDADGVTVKLASGGEERGDLLVGADGLRSTVRAQLLGDQPPRYAGWIALRGIAPSFSHPSFPIGFARQALGRARSFGMWHISDGRVYWVGTTTMPEEAAVEPGAARKQLVRRLFGGAPTPMPALVEATPADAILQNAIYDRLPVDSWSEGRVVLLGDAAHPTTPVTGQGGGQAIIDAAVLAKELDAVVDLGSSSALAAAFQRYEARRMQVTSAISTEAWRLGVMHHFSNPLLCWGRDLSLRLTPGSVWRRRMERRLAF